MQEQCSSNKAGSLRQKASDVRQKASDVRPKASDVRQKASDEDLFRQKEYNKRMIA